MSQGWHRLVASLEEAFQRLETEFHEAYWDSQVAASPETDRRRAALELELRRVKGDPEALAQVRKALGEEIHDPLFRRRLEVLRLSLTGNQMRDDQRAALVEVSTAIESDYAAYRPKLDGERVSENDIEQILLTSTDEGERRGAWEASKEIGVRVSDRVREVARLRNEIAHDLGFGDYYNFALALQEIDEDWLFAILADLEDLTDEPFREWKRGVDADLSEKFGTSELRPWHYDDPFFQMLPAGSKVDITHLIGEADAVALAEKTFRDWDIDLGPVMKSSDLYPRDRKCQHAFCLHVDRADDVRILANVVPGERWIEVMLHESGHAAYDVSIDPMLPYLLRRPAHTFVTEAIAIMSGRLIRRPEWLTVVAGAERSSVAVIESDLRSAAAAQSLLFMRWGLVVVHFERELYADPEGDLNERWWDLVERFQLVERPPGRDAPDWAAKIHVAVAPAYYQNYLLGEMLAAQLERTCIDEAGGIVGNRDAGRILTERIFRPGSSRRWNQLIESATGKPLDGSAFAASVTP